MDPPDDDVVTTESEYIVDSHEDWQVDRDGGGEIASFVAEESASVAVPRGPTLHTMTKTESSVNANDPTTATIKNEAEYALEYESETVSSKASSHVTHNYATVSVRVTVDDQTIFQKEWVGDGI
jgi:hypothetical protein